MIRELQKYVGRILDETPPARANAWAGWYRDAGGWSTLLDADYELTPGTAAGFVAALSPLNSWDTQLAYTPPSLAACLELQRAGRRVHEGIRGPGFFSNKDKAARIFQGENPLDVLGGDKVRSFFRNLTGDLAAVTIDRHAVAIVGWNASLTSRAYARLSFVYAEAGKPFGLAPAECQALTWNHWRLNHAAHAAANQRRAEV